jgi:hypothetical protein
MKTRRLRRRLVVMRFKKTLRGGSASRDTKYPYLPIDLVEKYEKLANFYDISHVARGLKRATKSDEGFLVVYKRVGGNREKLRGVPIFKSRGLDGSMNYDVYREKFLNSRLGQIKHAKTPLFNEDGLPTIQHTIMIMHAYSPDVAKIRKAAKLIDAFISQKNKV